MRALSALEMLEVWERGLSLSPVQRALTLLAAASSETPDAVAQLSIGERDARLLILREWMFGSQLVSVAICPGCGERLELSLSTADLRVGGDAVRRETLSLSVAGYELRFRPPNSVDLIAIANYPDAAAARRQLLERCLSRSERNGVPVSANQLPGEVVEALVERMAQADPQSDVQLALCCPQCGHRWQASFDIGSFFWSEINAWAHRTLKDVHTLASAYGWREMDILNMSAWRRQFYLNCIGR